MSGLTIVGGASTEDEEDEPVVMLDRGVYFDGIDDFLAVESNMLMLSISWAASAWVRPVKFGSCVLLSVNKEVATGPGSDDFITWSFQT
jgi:hypothetical protein